MARGSKKDGKAEEPRSVQPASSSTSTDGFTRTVADMRVAKAKDEKAAKRKLKEAEAKLKELERRQTKAVRTRVRKERALDRKLKRIERAKDRPSVLPLVAVIVPHGVASAMAVLHLLWPSIELYEPVLYTPSPHWEVILLCYAAAVISSVALIANAPSRKAQEWARQGLFYYLSLVLITTFVGALLIFVLEPMEGYSVDWTLALWVLLILVAASGAGLPITYFVGRMGRARLLFRQGYHWIMGILTAVLGVSLILLPIFYIASEGWMFEVGLAMFVSGGLGILFAGTGSALHILGGALADRPMESIGA
jgi:hypothetical protein